jgi:hypothetical protein
MAKHTISRRIAADRGNAQFWAFLASLPVWAFCIALIAGAGYVVFGPSSDNDRESGLVVAGVVVVFAFFVSIIARWTHSGVRSALTPQRIQAMWLRRFQAEGGDAFRTSSVVDRLSRHGVAALTLQDRDVQLSFEQRRNRMAPLFWLFFIPVVVALGYLAYSSWNETQAAAEAFTPTADDFAGAIGQAFGNALGTAIVLIMIVIIAMIAFMAATLLIMAFTAISGPIGAAMSRNRDDYRGLPRLLERISKGRGPRGASIVRVSDANWRQAVTSSLGAVDVAIIDLSNVSDHVAWEIAEAARACTPSGLVFIRRDDAALSQDARNAVRSAIGCEPGDVIAYPARRNGNGERFARALREQICAAADLRHAMKA